MKDKSRQPKITAAHAPEYNMQRLPVLPLCDENYLFIP